MALSGGVRAILLLATLVLAAGPKSLAQNTPPAPSVPTQAGTVSSVSQTGLLPLFAVDMQVDPSWIDSANPASNSAKFPHSGVNDTFQQAWDGLKPAGFNMIRFPVELGDQQSAARLANLCRWAKVNNVSLIPVLKGTSAGRGDKTPLSDAVTTFIATVVSLLRAGDAQQLAAYTQISFYQLEDTLNHTGLHPHLGLQTAQQMLLGAADSLRKSELQALQGTGVPATPISINASFDFELIQQGAVAGVRLDAAAKQKAQDSLKQFFGPLAAAPSVDAVNVEWFPSSISAGGVDDFTALLATLKLAIPDKQIALTTGFSTAFSTSDQQSQFYTLAFTTLANFRATDGANSHFVGAIFREAFQGPGADTKSPKSAGDTSRWNWDVKARQLSQMWSRGKAFAELVWWLNKVQDNMGLLAFQSNGSGGVAVVPLPAMQAFLQISATVTQATENVAQQSSSATMQSSFQAGSGQPIAGDAASANAGAAQAAGTAQSSGSGYQQLFLTTLQQVTTQLTDGLTSKLTGTPGQAPQTQSAGDQTSAAQTTPLNQRTPSQNAYTTPNSAMANGGMTPPGTVLGANAVTLGPQDVTVDSSNMVVGHSVRITARLHNGSTNQDAIGLAVFIVDPSNTVTKRTGITVPRGGTSSVYLLWTPTQASPGSVQLSLQVLDASGAQIASAQVPAITVTSASGQGNGGAATSGSTSSPPSGTSNSFFAASGPGAGSPLVRSGIATTFVIGTVPSVIVTPQNSGTTLSAPHAAPSKSGPAAPPQIVAVKPGQRTGAGTQPVTPSSGTSGNAKTAVIPRAAGDTPSGASRSTSKAKSVITIAPNEDLSHGSAQGGTNNAPATPNASGNQRKVMTIAPDSSTSKSAGAPPAQPAPGNGKGALPGGTKTPATSNAGGSQRKVVTIVPNSAASKSAAGSPVQTAPGNGTVSPPTQSRASSKTPRAGTTGTGTRGGSASSSQQKNQPTVKPNSKVLPNPKKTTSPH
jgi:hypothetical protein